MGNKLIWLVQNALFGDEFGYDNFIAAIDASSERRISLDYAFWESTIDLKLTGVLPEDVIPFGTRSFVCYGFKNNWNISWDGAFEYPLLRCLGEDFINYDLQVAPLDELKVPEDGKVFIREAAGFNIIKGKVISAYAWSEWVEGFKAEQIQEAYTDWLIDKRQHDWHRIDGRTLFVVAPVKKIFDEFRVWVIGGKVVSSSQYIQGGEIKYTNSDDDNWKVNTYAQKIAERLPFKMQNYVLDIFVTDKGLKVGEINCMHCSGWYAINSRKVVEAITREKSL